MSTPKVPNKWVRLEFPAQLQIGLRRLGELCDWRVREHDGAIWVATEERYKNLRPQMVSLVKVADAKSANDEAGYRRFDTWPGQDEFRTPEMLPMVLEMPEVTNPKDHFDPWVAFRLLFMTLPDAAVPKYMRDVFRQMVASMDTASLWAIEMPQRFQWRVASVRVLFSAQEAPEVLDRVPGAAGHEARLFSAAQGLSQSWSYGQSVFVEPVLISASPWISGLSSYRRGGSAVFLFGTPAPGFAGKQAAQGSDLFRAGNLAGPRLPVPRPEHPPAAYESALTWWVGRLNDVFAMALDIGRFGDANGNYQAAAHLGVLLSLERLFTSVETILAEASGGEFVRLMLFFDVMDLFDGLNFGSWDSLLRRDKVERDLITLEQTLPPDARDLLLTRCRPAVSALADLERGFTLRERIVGDQLRLRQRDGKGWQDTALTTAVPKFLRLARNATHSFRKMARDPHEVSVLAAHNGEIPDAISDLAFLHLLRFLQNPRLPTA